MITFIEKKLKLKINREKGRIDRPWNRRFLGFSFTPSVKGKARIRIHKESIERAKGRGQDLTSRRKSTSMEARIEKLNRFLIG
ncbi:maturase [Bacillus sp. FJAT-44742]|uniref:maturase n=1 Tax=Bacillus sp. FJAT-44742 TaxID=2014005 RepID=UPI001E42F40B|nr:maturase [Bacillus sp. FJAT-44742]